MATKITQEVIDSFKIKKNNLELLNDYGILYYDFELSQLEISMFYRKLSGEKFATASTSYANPKRNDNLSCYYTDHKKFKDWRLYKLIKKKMESLNFKVELEVAHVNITSIATRPVHHIDGTTPTAIYYPNPKWENEWGGETWLMNEQHEIADAVKYRPGRLIIFNGNRPHISRPPTHYSKGVNRLALAVRFAFIDSEGKKQFQIPEKNFEFIN